MNRLILTRAGLTRMCGWPYGIFTGLETAKSKGPAHGPDLSRILPIDTLPVAELRSTLFHEGGHTFLLILGREERMEGAALIKQTFA